VAFANRGGLTQSTFPGGTDPAGTRLLYRGAEADVILGDWQGLEAVYKVRKPLNYRLSALDALIRHQRTLREADMLNRAKRAGVLAPYLYSVDPEQATLVMEYVRGDRVKDLVDRLEAGPLFRLFREFGRATARLHAAGIMHGDLTTANVVQRGADLIFIDFGLSLHSVRVEDHAVDLRLIKETLAGAHPAVAVQAFLALREGYTGEAGPKSASVFTQLGGIERRGRYARVV
jgi:Kae1-associated kinase Bud32